MITGDHPRTAAVIARELGITTDGRAMTGAELDELSPEAAPRTVAERLGVRAGESRAQAAHRRCTAARPARWSP